uniref:ANK_REP_REGION domain-containing protein n=1 Tax=Macrostomum lignano TaxID=282301 RepID=A0A1I8JDY8_9PLAT
MLARYALKAEESREVREEMAHCGYVSSTQLLLDSGCRASARALNGFTALHIACKKGRVRIVELLLNYGAEPDAATDVTGLTPLHVAAFLGQTACAALLVDRGRGNASAVTAKGETPLHMAMRGGHTETARLLLEQTKVNADAAATDGQTSLHVACRTGNAEAVELLLKAGANPDAACRDGYTGLHFAAREGHDAVIRILLNSQQQEWPAARLQPVTRKGATPLHLAARSDQAVVTRQLVEAGADLNCVGGRGAGAKPQCTGGSSGQTPLHLAAREGHIEVVRLLLDQPGVTADCRNAQNLTPAHLANQTNQVEIFELLKPLTTSSAWQAEVKDDADRAPESAISEDLATVISESDDETAHMTEATFTQLPASPIFSRPDSGVVADGQAKDQQQQQQKQNQLQVPGASRTNVNQAAVPEPECQKQSAATAAASVPVPNIQQLEPKLLLLQQQQETPSDQMPVLTSFLVSFIVDARGGAMTGARCPGLRVVVPPKAAGEPLRLTCRLLRPDRLTSPPQLCDGEGLASRILELGGGGVDGTFRSPIVLEVPHIAALRNETALIGPEGGAITSTGVSRQVQAIFPDGALTKKIRVAIQVMPIPLETAAQLAQVVSASPIVTIEPRRRKFHKPITLTIPVPPRPSGQTDNWTLRLMCSITGGAQVAAWEDITGSTPLSRVKECVSFTTTVSARFWLLDCPNGTDAVSLATRIYRDCLPVPYIGRFVVYAKRNRPDGAMLRCLCVTDDKLDKTLECAEGYERKAESAEFEVLDGRKRWVTDAPGNLTVIADHEATLEKQQQSEQQQRQSLTMTVRPFRENRLSCQVRVSQPDRPAVGRLVLEPASGSACSVELALPEYDGPPMPTPPQSDRQQPQRLSDPSSRETTPEPLRLTSDTIARAELDIRDVAEKLRSDWSLAAQELGLTDSDIAEIAANRPDDRERAMSMLRRWRRIKEPSGEATGNALEAALRRIGRDDVVKQCMRNVQYVTEPKEHEQARALLDGKDDSKTAVEVHEADVVPQLDETRPKPKSAPTAEEAEAARRVKIDAYVGLLESLDQMLPDPESLINSHDRDWKDAEPIEEEAISAKARKQVESGEASSPTQVEELLSKLDSLPDQSMAPEAEPPEDDKLFRDASFEQQALEIEDDVANACGGRTQAVRALLDFVRLPKRPTPPASLPLTPAKAAAANIEPAKVDADSSDAATDAERRRSLNSLMIRAMEHEDSLRSEMRSLSIDEALNAPDATPQVEEKSISEEMSRPISPMETVDSEMATPVQDVAPSFESANTAASAAAEFSSQEALEEAFEKARELPSAQSSSYASATEEEDDDEAAGRSWTEPQLQSSSLFHSGGIRPEELVSPTKEETAEPGRRFSALVSSEYTYRRMEEKLDSPVQSPVDAYKKFPPQHQQPAAPEQSPQPAPSQEDENSAFDARLQRAEELMAEAECVIVNRYTGIDEDIEQVGLEIDRVIPDSMLVSTTTAASKSPDRLEPDWSRQLSEPEAAVPEEEAEGVAIETETQVLAVKLHKHKDTLSGSAEYEHFAEREETQAPAEPEETEA